SPGPGFPGRIESADAASLARRDRRLAAARRCRDAGASRRFHRCGGTAGGIAGGAPPRHGGQPDRRGAGLGAGGGQARRGGPRGDELAIYAEHAIAAVRGRLLIRPPDTRPHVYYGRRADGLETALPGSPSGEAIDEAGAIDVAAPLGRGRLVAITRDELFAW